MGSKDVEKNDSSFTLTRISDGDGVVGDGDGGGHQERRSDQEEVHRDLSILPNLLLTDALVIRANIGFF